MRPSLRAAFLAALFVPAVGVAAPPPPLWDKLGARVSEVDRRLDGVLGLSVHDLTSDAVLDLRADEAFPTASSIKLAVLYELFRQADEGTIDLSEVTRPPLPRVRGGGVLQDLSDHVSLTWRDLAVLMFGWSDNEATNRLIDRVGMGPVARRMNALGLPGIRLRRKMMDLEAARRGDENVAPPAELRKLAEAAYQGVGLSPARAKDLQTFAAVPEKGSSFRAGLREGVKALVKSGELEGVRCEVGYVDLPGRPYAAAIMTKYLRRDAEGEAAIREISAALFDTFDRLARSSEYGRVVSER